MIHHYHRRIPVDIHSLSSFLYKPVSQSCPVAKRGNFWPVTGQLNLAHKQLAVMKASKSLVSVLTQLHFGQWSKSSILSAKFDCPVARQNFVLLATAHDCETGLLTVFKLVVFPYSLVSCWLLLSKLEHNPQVSNGKRQPSKQCHFRERLLL